MHKQKASYRIIPWHFINASLEQSLIVEVNPLLIKAEKIKLTTKFITMYRHVLDPHFIELNDGHKVVVAKFWSLQLEIFMKMGDK